jgi:Ca2+-binding EF-hand superfamily protein
MKAILIGAAVAAFAMPAVAQMADGPGKLYTQTTRADAEAKARAKFAERDTNHDGFITPEEIRVGIEARMGKMQDMAFDRIDADKNGAISREEFTARRDHPGGPRIVERRIERMAPDDVKDGPAPGKGEMRVMMMHKGGPDGGHMMMMTDADHDGRISQAEAVAGALKLFDQTDTNHDGTVTPEERHAAMQAWGAKMHEHMGDMPPPPPPPAG